MPKRQLAYRGFDIHIDMLIKTMPYQVWVADTHVIAAGSLKEMFANIDAYLLRVGRAEAA